MRKKLQAVLGALVLSSPVSALELDLPGPAEVSAERVEAFGSLRLPTGPFAGGVLPTQLVEGALSQTAFRLAGQNLSTLEVLQGLRVQAEAAGYTLAFTCETEACGGYDFRYGMAVLPEPDMHVNLGDFRYLLATGPAGEVLALLVSRSGTTGFVQVTRVGAGAAGKVQATPEATPEATAGPQPTAPPTPQSKPAQPGLIAGIEAGRAVVLEDLVFASGSSALVGDDYPSLRMLADWLQADPARKVVLVGHTDASGALEANIKLSRLRAESVRQTLLYAQNISPEQVQAEGIGPLSPRVSNLTEEGRRQNRRVEALMTSTALLTP